MSGDIKIVFLSGDEEHRNILMLPLDDIRDILKPIPEPMLRLRKAVHGLVNAKWWYSLKRSLLNNRLTSRALDPCSFVLIKTNTKSEV